MPVERIPLFGFPLQRGPDPRNNQSKDWLFENTFFRVERNPVTREQFIYVEKRAGLKQYQTFGVSQAGRCVEDNYTFIQLDHCFLVYDFGVGPDMRVMLGSTTVGNAGVSLDSSVSHVRKTRINDEEGYLFSTLGRGVYYIGETGMLTVASFTASATSGAKTLSSVSSIVGLELGQFLTGTGIPSNSYITKITSGTPNLVTMNAAASATNADISVNRQRVSKCNGVWISGSPFSTGTIGPAVEINGYAIVAEQNSQKIYHSDLNDIFTWNSANLITANQTPGLIIGLQRVGEYVAAIKTDGVEFFYLAGNDTGSVLSRANHLTIRQANFLRHAGTTKSYWGGQDVMKNLLHDELDGTCVIIGAGVWSLAPGQLTKISNTAIDRLIYNLDFTELRVRLFYYLGKKHCLICKNYGLNHADNWAYICDLELNTWTSLSFQGKGIMDISPRGEIVLYDIGKAAYWCFDSLEDTPTWTDARTLASAYTMSCVTANWDAGNMHDKTIHCVRLIADNEASGSAYISWSDDDYTTFSADRPVDMTKVDKTVWNCGVTKRRAFRIKHYDATPFRGQALEIEYTVNPTTAGVK